MKVYKCKVCGVAEVNWYKRTCADCLTKPKYCYKCKCNLIEPSNRGMCMACDLKTQKTNN